MIVGGVVSPTGGGEAGFLVSSLLGPVVSEGFNLTVSGSARYERAHGGEEETIEIKAVH
jgi:hypothetical protein